MLYKRTRVLLLFLMLVVIAACEPAAPEAVVLPTLAQLPTLTPSNTPTSTLTPTPSETPTETLTPTPTETPTLTPSATVTPTPPPTLTPLPTLTSTPTITPLPTLTPTLPIPTATATSPAPVITAYTASAVSGAPNTPVTLSWTAAADSARIDVLNAQGAVTQTFPVPPSGQFSVSVPANAGRQIVFRLVALRAGQEVGSNLPFTIQCTTPWFFGDQLAPPTAGCPQALGTITAGAYQPFERGLMLWLDSTDRVYGLQNELNRYIVIDPDWDEGDDERDDNPPDNLERPERWFNWVYYRTNAPIGSWNNALGWATDELKEATLTIQFEQGTGAFYINTPDNEQVYRFSGGDVGTWQRIK